MGIEWVHTPAARAPLALSWEDTTFRKILDVITKDLTGIRGEGWRRRCPCLFNERSLESEFPASENQAVRGAVDLAERRLRDLVRLSVAPRNQVAVGVAEVSLRMWVRRRDD
jgi:hypothetical protein